jgi:hypothetical protein
VTPAVQEGGNRTPTGHEKRYNFLIFKRLLIRLSALATHLLPVYLIAALPRRPGQRLRLAVEKLLFGLEDEIVNSWEGEM